MIVCFIFIEDVNADHCVGVKVYHKNATVSEPQHLSLAECHAWQKNYPTTIVLNTQNFGIYRLNLPKLSKNKIHSAIGYALEDKIIHPKETLHIATQSKNNGETIAVYCEKTLLENVIFSLQEHHIKYDCITIDWCALAPGGAFLLPKRVIVNHEVFTGGLGYEDYIQYAAQHEPNSIVHYHKNISYLAALPKNINMNHFSAHHYQWLADKLAYQNPINLLQNDYHISNTVEVTVEQQKLFGKLYLAWLLGIGLIFMLSFSLQGIHKFWLQTKYNRILKQQTAHYGGNYLDNGNAWRILSGSVKVLHRLNLHAMQVTFSDHKLFLKMTKIPAAKQKQLQQKFALLDLDASIMNSNQQSDTWIIQQSKE
jgi:type II secretory pathway component PulL